MTTVPFRDLIAKASGPSPLVRTGARGFTAAQASTEQRDAPIFSFSDVAKAPFRGVAKAAGAAYGLVDTLAFDALPDYDERVFGRSRSVVGGFVEGAFQFASGFLPGLGVAGLATKAVGLTATVGRAGMIARATKATLAGAFGDFVAFDGHEARLSNLVEQFPHLSNPITQYLAADDSDSQLEGRFKNALEGAGIGLLTDAVFLGIKGLRAGRKVRAAGGTPKAVDAAVESVVDKAALEGSMRNAANEGSGVAAAAARGEDLDAARALDTHRAEVEIDLANNPPPTTGRDTLVDLGLEIEDVDTFFDDSAAAARRADDPAESSAARLTTFQGLERMLARNETNLDNFAGPGGVQRLWRSLDPLVRDVAEKQFDNLTPRVQQEALEIAQSEVADVLQMPEGIAQLTATLAPGLKSGKDNTMFTMRVRAMFSVAGPFAAKAIRFARDPTRTNALAKAKAMEALGFLGDVNATLQGVAAEGGRNLGQFRLRITTNASLLRKLDAAAAAGDVAPKVPKGAPGVPTPKAPTPKDLDDMARELIDSAGGESAVDRYLAMMDELLKDGTDFRDVAGFTATTGPKRGKNAMNMTVEAWINALLGGARTWTTNTVVPLMAAVWVPMERVVGGAIMGDSTAMHSGIAQITGLFRDSNEAFRLGLESFKKRRPVLLPRSGFNDPFGRGSFADAAVKNAQIAGERTPGAFSPAVRGIDPTSLAGQVGAFMDTIVPFASSVIGGTDEFVKQLSFRSVARDELTRKALGLRLGPEEATKFVDDFMRVTIDNGEAFSRDRLYREGLELNRRQGLKGVELLQAAEQHAEQQFDTFESFLSPIVAKATKRANEVTFQEALERGTLGRGLQDIVVQQPLLRLLALPFVKTPTNLLKFAGRRVDPFGPLQVLAVKKFGAQAPALDEVRNRFVQEYLSGDPIKQADAVGRVATGMATMTAFVGLAATGQITGRGPSDPERRRLMVEAGWKPYSLKVGNSYVEYRRMDPWATMMGFAADTFEYANWADTDDQTDVETVFLAGLTAASNSLTQASYLTGVRNFTDALSSPENKMATFVQSMTSSIAVPQIVAQFTVPAGDENFREARSILDASIRRIPGLSDTLEPRRNLFGEPVRKTRRLGQDQLGSLMNVWMPLAYSEVSDDVVDRELALLQHGFSPPKPRKGDLNMLEYRSPTGQTAFDRWSQLQGEVAIGGRTLRQRLRSLVTSSQYQALSAESLPNVTSPRVTLVSREIRRYRDKAFDQTLREYDALADRWRQLGGNRATAFRAEALRYREQQRRIGPLAGLLSPVTQPNPERFRSQITRR